MQRIADSIHLRYGLAILVTSALMIWVSVNERPLDDWSNQIVFWAIAVTAGWLQMILIARGVRASFGVDRYPGWVLWAATALIGAVPLTFQVRWLMDTIVAPSGGLPPPWVTYLNVTVINSVFCLLQYILIERWPLFAPSLEDAGTPQPLPVAEALDASEASEPTSAPLPTVGMLRRRPDGLNGTIRYMQMEDHYLRVHTDEGAGLTLHRMADAVEDLAESDGLQVHKSWWIAHAAVAEVRQIGRRRVLVATDGAEVPVGRSFEPTLRAAGWF